MVRAPELLGVRVESQRSLPVNGPRERLHVRISPDRRAPAEARHEELPEEPLPLQRQPLAIGDHAVVVDQERPSLRGHRGIMADRALILRLPIPSLRV